MSKVTDRAHRCALAIGWRMPFILPPLTHCEIREAATDGSGPAVGTFGVQLTKTGAIIWVNPDFALKLSDKHVGGVMAHELMHLILLHSDRRGSRNTARWNRATDRAINQILRTGEVELPDGALYPDYNHQDADAETLYDVEPTQSGDEGGGMAIVGQGCGVMEAPQDGQGTSPNASEGLSGLGDLPGGEGTGQGSEKGTGGKPGASGDASGKVPGPAEAPAEQVWREVAIQARSLARGTTAGNMLARILEPPPAKTSFEQVLRGAAQQAMNNHGRDDQTWARKSRRSPPRIILPGWTAYKARLAVVIDASGSVSDEMLARATSETVKLQRQHAGLRIFLVVHDSRVYTEEWVRATTAHEVQKRIRGRGGTDFVEAYQAVDRAGKFDACVHLTDGEIGHWPDPPENARKFVVALLGGRGDTPPDGTITIPVEGY